MRLIRELLAKWKRSRDKRRYMRMVDRSLAGRMRGATIEQFTYWPMYEPPEYGTPCGELWYEYTTEAMMKNAELEYFAASWQAEQNHIQQLHDAYYSECEMIT